MSLCPGHRAVEEERTEVRGQCLSLLPARPGQSQREGSGGLDRPVGPGSGASSEHRLRGRWHTKLVWLPQADLVAVRQAAARRVGQVGTRHQGLDWRQGCWPESGSRSCSGLGVGGGVEHPVLFEGFSSPNPTLSFVFQRRIEPLLRAG